MFELESMTTVRVLDVRVLSRKDRKPDEQPGAQLLLQATLGVSVLAMFDGFLPGMLYRKGQAKKQGELDGIETAELTAVGEHVKRMPWVYEQTGCTLTVDYGRGGDANLVLADAKVHRVSLRPEQKGVVIQWTADVPALNDQTRGKLTGLKSTDVKLTMTGPEVDDSQGEIDGTGRPPAHGSSKKGQASKDALDASGKNPFPAGGAKTDEEIRQEALRSGTPAKTTAKPASASVQ